MTEMGDGKWEDSESHNPLEEKVGCHIFNWSDSLKKLITASTMSPTIEGAT